MGEPAGPGPEEGQDHRRLHPVTPAALLSWALVGLVAGWLVRPVAIATDLTAPRVPWLQVGALYLVAAVLAVVARGTHRAVQQGRHRIRAEEAVNRLVLAKSCALAGSLVTGGYLGYALTWVGVDALLAQERIVHSLVAAGGAVLTVGAALALERACRVRDDDGEP